MTWTPNPHALFHAYVTGERRVEHFDPVEAKVLAPLLIAAPAYQSSKDPSHSQVVRDVAQLYAISNPEPTE